MSRGKKYSLLVPCYNAQNYIEGFIENLETLILPFDEIIFYDDASEDNTVQILISKGLNVIQGKTNKGPGYARNKLVENSTCEWFHFHDIDDLLTPDYLTRTSELAEKGKFDVILCNVNWFDSRTKKLVRSWEYSDTEMNQNPLVYTISNPIGGINGLYRKTKFIETGGFNTTIRIWEDADIHVRLAGKNAIFHVIEEVLSYSIRYPTSTSPNQKLGWLTRANLLGEYYKIYKQEVVRSEIGTQAQLVASYLILYLQNNAAREALQLSELCNVKVPKNTSKVWTLLKKIIPAPLRIELRLLHLKVAFRSSTRF